MKRGPENLQSFRQDQRNARNLKVIAGYFLFRYYAQLLPTLARYSDAVCVSCVSRNLGSVDQSMSDFLKWDRLPACHFQYDRLEAYPTNWPIPLIDRMILSITISV